MKQTTFASLAWNAKGRTTRRERFLGEMNAVVPWARLTALIEAVYPKGKGGRPAMPLERMLRVYFMQQWFNLWVANSQYEGIRLCGAVLHALAIMVRSHHASPLHSRHPPAGHTGDTPPARWHACRRCRIVVAEASAAHRQSLPPSRSESHHPRSRGARADHTDREPAPDSEAGRAHQAGNAVQVPQSVGRSEISPALLLPRPSPQTWPQRSLGRTHRGDC